MKNHYASTVALALALASPTVFAQQTAPAVASAPTPTPAAPATPPNPVPVRPPETATGNTGAAAAAPAAPTPAPSPEEAYLEGLRKELSRLGLERDKLTAENTIARATLEKELTDRRANLEREKLRLDEQKQKEDTRAAEERRKMEEKLMQLRMENERLTLESSVAKAKSDIQLTEQRMKEADARAQITALQAAMERQDVESTANNYAGVRPLQLAEPLQGETLVISDRRIPLNGPISAETAEYISTRLNYYNNKDAKLPIFIVIDSSPGGSVMAGYNILKSMESSQAPVYVVVKSFAASMAACITTCADKSFCYPNAVVLHHQLSGVVFGNLTTQREGLAETEEWWRRLAGPVAQKMGLTTEEFIKRMYTEVHSGDWSVFGDKASQLKWVDHVVKEIRETALVKNPDFAKPAVTSIPMPMPMPMPRPGPAGEQTSTTGIEEVDAKGVPFMRVPRLAPKDFYYLYNPDGYYRLP